MNVPPLKLDPELARVVAARAGVTLTEDGARAATSMNGPIAGADAMSRQIAFEAEPASFLVVQRPVQR